MYTVSQNKTGPFLSRGVEKIRDFLPISRYISQTLQNIAIYGR